MTKMAHAKSQYKPCADFDAVAEQRYAGIVASRKTIAWSDIRVYPEKRMSGELAKRPVARKLAR